jgi:acyl carrier protein
MDAVMDNTIVESKIVAIIADISGFDEEEITHDKNFFKDLEVDSIKAIEITVAIEKKFGISVRDEDVPKITTVREAVDLVARLLKEQKQPA